MQNTQSQLDTLLQPVIALFHQGQHGEVIARAKNLLASYDHPLLWRLLGFSLCVNGNYADALPVLEKVQQLFQTDPEVFKVLAVTLRGLNRLNEAEQYFRKGLQANPGDVDILQGLGWILFTQERYYEALGVFERAAFLKAPDAGVCKGLGLSYFAIRHIQKAEIYIKKSLELNPGDIFLRFNLECCNRTFSTITTARNGH